MMAQMLVAIPPRSNSFGNSKTTKFLWLSFTFLLTFPRVYSSVHPPIHNASSDCSLAQLSFIRTT